MTNQEEQYLKLYSMDRINSFEAIRICEGIDIEEARRRYKNISQYIGTKLELTELDVKEIHKKLKSEIEKRQYVFEQFNEKRRIGFGNFPAFYILH